MTKVQSLVAYCVMALAAVASVWMFIHLLPSNPSIGVSNSEINQTKNAFFVQLLIALSFILVTTQLFAKGAKKLGEPAVVGEILGGIVLGPSVIGYFFPEFFGMIFPESLFPYIAIIAQLGIVFYMFVIGLEFDLSSLKEKAHSTLLISHVSIVFPMILGLFLGAFTFKDFAPAGVQPLHHALFVGISLSITAFPVLARILTDKGLDKTFVGKTALACAAIDDVTAWSLLAICLSLMQENIQKGLFTLGLSLLYIFIMLKFIRPILSSWILKLDNQDKISLERIAFFFVALFLSSLATELIGIHAIFGAFLLGVIIPHNSQVKCQLTQYTENLSRVVLLPAFFVYTGLRTEISLLSTWSDWGLCAVIVLIATIAKFGGATIASRFSGISWRESSAIGILMNTRGLVELVVLNIGLDIGVINSKLFTVLVIMALLTTFITSPVLRLILGEAKKQPRGPLNTAT